MNQLQINTALQISRPKEEVFKAIVDPQKMSGYFILESTGPMEEGSRLTWRFPEFEERVSVSVLKVTPHEKISFEWEGVKGKLLQVDIALSDRPNNNTLVRISEGKMENNEEGITWLTRNTEGWANFLACLKAYLEHDINLRNGAFDFLKE
ncbi:MAG: SRPBCC domain-containing protein [Candidatus Cyclobacteriaceae bacterium M2_1C_046]